MSDEQTPADRLERALRDNEARRKAAAELAAKGAPETERMRALQAQLDALPQSERRAILNSIGMAHVSGAPRPLAPLRASGYSDRFRLRPVRWSVWRALPHVSLWEAVLLSMNIEPRERMRSELQHGPLRGARRVGPRFLSDEAFERLDLCRRTLSLNGPLHPQGMQPNGSLLDAMACPVLLSEVAVLLERASFASPNEMSLPANVPEKPESREEREDRRLKACEDAGLTMPAASVGRLPDGIGKVAAAAGLTRQAFSDDVRAALKRREERRKAGSR